MNAVIIALISLFLIAYGLISGKAQRTIISAPMVFVCFGILIGNSGFGLIPLHRDSALIHILAEVTLISILFTDAARIDLKLLRKEHIIPKRLLLIGLPLCIVIGAWVATGLIKSLNIWEGLVLAAILAPTDAALGQSVVSSPLIPVKIRQALNVESGLNDGIALPAVIIGICLAACVHTESASHWILFSSKQIVLGPLIGIAIGFLGGKLIDKANQNDYMTHSFRDLAILALAFFAFGMAELVHGNGFIAVFCAGLILGNTVRNSCECLYEFSESEGQLLSLLMFMIFGAIMVPPALEYVSWPVLLYALLSLTFIRIVPALIALSGTGLRNDTKLFISWFGPRGIASILFVLLVFEEADFAAGEQIFSIVVWTVLLSIFAHGISAVPATRAYAARLKRSSKSAVMEHEDATAMPTRLKWNEH